MFKVTPSMLWDIIFKIHCTPQFSIIPLSFKGVSSKFDNLFFISGQFLLKSVVIWRRLQPACFNWAQNKLGWLDIFDTFIFQSVHIINFQCQHFMYFYNFLFNKVYFYNFLSHISASLCIKLGLKIWWQIIIRSLFSIRSIIWPVDNYQCTIQQNTVGVVTLQSVPSR